MQPGDTSAIAQKDAAGRASGGTHQNFIDRQGGLDLCPARCCLRQSSAPSPARTSRNRSVQA